MARRPPAAHLLPPLPAQLLPRPRLLQWLDAQAAAPACRALWLGAPAGSGKSTLAAAWCQRRASAHWLRIDAGDADIASLAEHLRELLQHAGGARALRHWPALTREHLALPLAGLRRCLRALFARLPDEAVLVLDDVQHLGPAEAAAPTLRLLLDEARAGQRILLLSRCPCPPALEALQAAGRLAVLPAAELAFDADEAAAFAARHPCTGDGDGDGEAWRQRSAGWPLGMAWLAGGHGAQALPRLAAGAWLEALERPEREALEQAAWCAVVDETLLGRAAMAKLRSLASRGLPIEPQGGPPHAASLRLHELLREALQQAQQQTLDEAALAARLAGLADALQAARRDDEALPLRLRAAGLRPEHAPAANAALLALAPAWLSAARHGALRSAIETLPAALRGAPVWLLLAQAELPRSPAAARAAADQALALAPDDTALAAQCHALAIATHFQSFDDTRPLAARVAALRALGVTPAHCDVSRGPQAALAVGVWSALFLRQPTHPDAPAWQQRVTALLHEPLDPTLKLRAAMLLAKHGWYHGEHGELAALPALVQPELRRPGLQPYGRLLWGLMSQYAAWAQADWARGLQATHEALAFAQEAGIPLLDVHLRLHGACFAALAGDEAASAGWMAEVAAVADASRHMQAWHHFSVRAWLALRQGQPAQAEAAGRVALQAASAMGPAPQAMALALRCHALQGLGDEAGLAPARRELGALAEATGNRLAMLHARLIDARAAAARGERERCLQALQQALRSAQGGGLWAPFGIDPAATASLLAEALAAGVERPAAQRLARAMALVPPPQAGPHWPWKVRVRTFGGLTLEVDGQAVPANGKPQKRPLELLQALIALGGAAGRERLADLLWPEAEGDRALDALEVALRRLRQLLGHADALRLRGGRLEIDPACVWVDALAGAAPPPGPHAAASFLPEQAAPWAASAREQLARGAPLAARPA